MAVNLHAVLLLAIPAIVVITCLVAPRRHVAERGPLHAAGIAIGVSAGILLVTARQQPGEPFSQCFIMGVTIWLILRFVDGGRLRAGLVTVTAITMFVLAFHYGVLVRSGQWVGDAPLHPLAVEDVNRSYLIQCKKLVQENCPDDQVTYSPGWLDEMPFAACFRSELPRHPMYRIEVRRDWHSWYTRLFHYREIPVAVWFPGGIPAPAADSMVLKEFPSAPASAASQR